MAAPSHLVIRRQPDNNSQTGESFTECVLLGTLACAISILGFLYFFWRGEILLYGDAIAHINIARRVFDSRTPGPLQLGTVWLPLPHVLMIPFLISGWMWRTGVGGSLVSMAAYVAGVLGIFRLVRNGLAFISASPGAARAASWLAAVIYAANPNLIYLQATAMTESLNLALFVWAMVYFSEFSYEVLATSVVEHGSEIRATRFLMRCGWLLMASMLTRYDGWFAGGCFAVATLGVVWVAGRNQGQGWRRPLVKFLLITAAAPMLWFAYNAFVWGNPLEFATGPYSARGIEQRTRRPGDPHHPGWHSTRVAALYFVKAAELNLGEFKPQSTWFPMAVLGTGLVLVLARPLTRWLLLWAPLPFYALSMAYGGVPIFIPSWWPFSYYNVRYGIQLLPAIAVFGAATLFFLMRWTRSQFWQAGVVTAAFSLVAAAYLQAWMAVPISLQEAQVNSRAKAVLERSLAHRLQQLPASATLLMYIGEHGGSLQQAGIPLRRTINEGPWLAFGYSRH